MPAVVARLPALRQDLQLLPANRDARGEDNWLIYDPLRHRYFSIVAQTFRLLSMWQPGMDSRKLLQQAAQAGLDIDQDRLLSVLDFLRQNQLLQSRDRQTREHLLQVSKNPGQGLLAWLIHHYLFIRIPLFKPDIFLQKTAGVAGVFFSMPLLWIIRLLGIAGVLLVFRQWQEFTQTFSYFFNWQGIAFYGLALVFIKSAHELGHAYTAHRLGCRVTSIGVALLVMLPVLYTDTTDAWRLKNHRDRLAIALAGIKVELHIAMLATFLWSLAPDGAFKSAMFFIATTSWITSLAVNLSPFMRFDGYFMLVDLLRADNLQPRAFAMGRWQLREWLFGFGEAPPEQLPSKRRWQFVLYAWMTWIYRFFLFLGIALLVYHFAFKLLGITLFVIEIAWFIVLPLKNEVTAWWKRKEMIRMNRQLMTSVFLLLCLLLMLFIPWQQSIHAVALQINPGYKNIYPPESARIKRLQVADGMLVAENDSLLELVNPELDRDIELVKRQMALTVSQLSLTRSAQPESAQTDILNETLAELQARQRGLELRKAKLLLSATLAGEVIFSRPLSAGQWVNSQDMLFAVKPEGQSSFVAFVDETDIHQVLVGSKAFWMSGYAEKLSLQVNRIDYSADSFLEYPELASIYGGDLPVREGDTKNLRTDRAFYKVYLQPQDTNYHLPAEQRTTGNIYLSGNSRSIAARVMDNLSALLVRESGF